MYNGFYASKKVNREVIDPTTNKSVGASTFIEATMIGKVLAVTDGGVKDRYDRTYQGVPVQIEPGYDRFMQSANPELHEQIRALVPGTIIHAVGVQKRNSSGMGFHMQVKELKVLEEGPTGPQPVPAAAIPAATETAAA